MSDDVRAWLFALGITATIAWNVYKYIKDRTREAVELERRVYSLETKVGLFWHLVEEHMSGILPKGNPINLTSDELQAARVYRAQKAHAPTEVLQTLSEALERELRQGYLSPDETSTFTFLLGAIRSQLFDRGAWQPADD